MYETVALPLSGIRFGAVIDTVGADPGAAPIVSVCVAVRMLPATSLVFTVSVYSLLA